MRIEILGESRIVLGGASHPLPGGREGLLLELLLTRPNQAVPAEELYPVLWPGVEKDIGRPRLRVVASRLRRHLSGEVRLTKGPGGYELEIPTPALDRLEFEELADAALGGDTSAAAKALTLWRGKPYRGFAATEQLRAERVRLLGIYSRLCVIADWPVSTSLPPVAGHVPPPLHGMVARPRLVDALPAAGEVRLLSVTAPRGTGKSVLLAQWAAREGGRVVWRRMTTEDNDPAAFWQGVVGSLGGRVSAGTGTQRWTVERLVNDLVGMEPVVLVIDDFDLVENPALHKQLVMLLRHMPPTVTVAIASRVVLPFSTARLHAAGDMEEVLAEDLCFSADETSAILARAGERWPQDARARLHQLVGGWPLAVAMAAAGDGGDPETVAAAVGDQIADAVLADLPSDATGFLLRTSVLETLEPDLCNRVTGRSDAAAMLEELSRRHLLAGTEAPSHHSLLSATLSRRLNDQQPEVAAAVNRGAARWYAEHGRPDRALGHAAAAGDAELEAELLRPAIEQVAMAGDGARLRHWAATLPLPEADEESLDTARLAAALLHRDERGLWAGGPEGHRAPAWLASLTEAVDRVDEGRCAEALDLCARAARELAEARPSLERLTARLAEALLAAVEADARLLLGGRREAGPPTNLMGPWPWLVLWTVGQRALDAYVAGDVAGASALIEYAGTYSSRLHASWRTIGDGCCTLTKAMIDSDAATDAAEQARVIAELEALVTRATRLRRVPTAAMARYALALARHRSGGEVAAAELLAQADAAAAAVPDLTLIGELRRRLWTDEGRPAGNAGLSRLTPQERAVLAYLDSDLTLSEIAAEMFLSVHTVHTHVKSLYRKLGVGTRAEAVARSH